MAVSCADGVYVITAAGGKVAKAGIVVHQPHGVTFSPDGAQIWVADSEQDQLMVIDSKSLRAIRVVPTGRTPWNTAFSADATKVYVTNTNDDTVSVIDASTLRPAGVVSLPSFTVDNLVVTTETYTQLHHQPTAIALSPADGSLWVACNSSSSLAVIDPATDTVSGSFEIGLGDDPTGIAFAAVS